MGADEGVRQQGQLLQPVAPCVNDESAARALRTAAMGALVEPDGFPARYTAPVKRYAAATQRNREPLLEVLRQSLPERGLVLEVASGTGQHAVFFARHLPELTWQPSDPSPEALASIRAWREERGTANLLEPLRLDVTEATWPVSGADAVVSINLLHIAAWEVGLALVRGAAARLPAGGPLVVYGPFLRDDVPTAPSNLAFDADLRARNPAWGLRHLSDLRAAAEAAGLAFDERLELPANNLAVVFRR
jgi:SAM-dependent methyltransferase